MQTFSEMITVGMKQKNLSLRAVARGIELDPSFFSKVLAGKRTPPSDEKVLTRLAGLLGLDPWKLIISTGMIPSQIRPMLENEDFLRSLRDGKPSPAKSSRTFSAPASAHASHSAAPVQGVSLRKRPELSEDLL